MIKQITLALLFFAFSTAFAESASISGQLFEKGTRVTLKEVNVFLLPHKLKATTDEQGRFQFENVPEGEFQLVVTLTGYVRLEMASTTENSGRRVLYLEKEKYDGFETTIVDQKQSRESAKKTLTQAQFLTLPGSGGDPVKAVQNLPGVNRVSGFSSNVVIQGSAPQDTKYDIQGHEIPIVFHFGGLTSVVMPEAVQSVDYLSAGYGPENSRAMGGIISLKTRDPDVKDRDRKGFFFIDNLKAGALVEGRINDKSSYLVSGRYSYVGLFLKQVLKDNEAFNLTVAPEFSDLTVVYKNKLSDTDDFRLNFVASRDTLSFVLKEPIKQEPSLRGNFRNETNFVKLIPEWSRKIDADRTVRASVGVGQDQLMADIGSNYFNTKVLSATVRGEWEQKMSSQWLTQIGVDSQFAESDVKLKLPYFNSSGGVSNPISSSEVREVNIKSRNTNLGAYWRNEYELTPTWSILPSLRVDQFSSTRETLPAPRFTVRHKWDESLLLKAATGIYYQPPRPQETAADYGNPNVKSPSSIHTMLGFEKDFREGKSEGLQLSGGFFRRDFRNLVIDSSATVVRDGVQVPEVYNNNGGGRAQGIEMQLKMDVAPWSGWISYTISESKRWDPIRPEYRFEYDQTHNFNVVGSYEWARNWKLSGRYRYVTGNPYTPIVSGSFDADNDVYIPKRGDIYSERQNAFQQLDLRLDKKWILDREIWSMYLDIQNVINMKSTEQIRYSYDYSQKETVTGLPFLPALGVKGEF